MLIHMGFNMNMCERVANNIVGLEKDANFSRIFVLCSVL